MAMISVNMLPYRHLLKRRAAIKTVVIFVLLAGMTSAAGGAWWGYLHMSNTELAAASAAKESEIGELKKKIGEIDATKKLKEASEKRLAVIDGLRWQRRGAALRFRGVAAALPPKAWLTKYAENGDNVAIGGTADIEETAAAFIHALENSAEFSSVEVISSDLVTLNGSSMKHFELTAKIRRPDAPAQPGPQKEAGK